MKAVSDKKCNQFKQGGSGEVMETECNSNPARALCEGQLITHLDISH